MRVLMIGGTRFVGRAIAEAASARGHEVTVFHRGHASQSPLPGIPGINEALGDRDGDLSALSQGTWEATVDVCGYRPHQVDVLADALDDRGGRHVFISTVSVYANDIPAGSTESAPLADPADIADIGPGGGLDTTTVPIDGRTYGRLKVLCEQRVRARHERPILIRPTYVVGPRDYSMRFPAWVRRIKEGGRIECPSPAENPVQYIDARDQAEFIVHLLEREASGTFHTSVPPPFTFGNMVDHIASAVAPAGTTFTWVEPEVAESRVADFPLWSGREPRGALAIDPSAALAAGLTLRPLSRTARDVADWLDTLGGD